MKTSISDSIYPVSTYEGNLDHSDNDNETIINDIQEGYLPDGINYDLMDCDYHQEYTKQLAEDFERAVRGSKKIMGAFKKYGIELKGFEFWSPREYNFQGDSIDMSYNVVKDFRKKLKPEIQEYIDTVRKKSCDGYMSLEPSGFEEVETNDFAYLWAILKKADILDDIRDELEDMVENSYETYSNCFYNGLYKWLEKNPVYTKWKAVKDYQESIERNNLKLAI
jgi:hypothetical protein